MGAALKGQKRQKKKGDLVLSHPWPRNSICFGVAKRGEKIFFVNHPEFHGSLVIKDLAMSLLWYWFSHWFRNFSVFQVQKIQNQKFEDPKVLLLVWFIYMSTRSFSGQVESCHTIWSLWKMLHTIFFIFGLFRAVLQGRGWIGAAAARLHHSHSNAGS